MTVRTYELHLEGLSSPSGQISLTDLAKLSDSLQKVATRVARQVLDVERPGRPPGVVDLISELRLTRLGDGSTTLDLEVGDVGALDLEGDEFDRFGEWFDEAMAGISSNRPPKWANPLVRQSASRMIRCLKEVGAQRATWGPRDKRRSAKRIMVVTELDDTVWQVEAAHETESVVVSGLLDLVDLRTRHFRIRDDVGHDVRLEEVVDVDAASRLIGQRVIAKGVAERIEGRLLRVVEPSLIIERLPTEWVAAIVENPPVGGPPPRSGITDVTAEDVEELLREICT